MNIKLHHFRDYVERGEITIHRVSTNDQRADYLIKPLNEVTHKKHKKESTRLVTEFTCSARGSVDINKE